MLEKNLQHNIIRWLKDQGAIVYKMQAGPGVPLGTPDIVFLFHEKYGTIEAKKDQHAKFQFGQEIMLTRLQAWNDFTYVVYPDNWTLVQHDLQARFFALSK